MNRVAEAYGDRTEFLYRLFPLPYHNNAFKAAKVRQPTSKQLRPMEAGSQGVDMFLPYNRTQ